jgi:hypothetical protein
MFVQIGVARYVARNVLRGGRQILAPVALHAPGFKLVEITAKLDGRAAPGGGAGLLTPWDRHSCTVASEQLGVPKTHRGYYISLFAGLHAIGSQAVEVKGVLGRFDLKIFPRRQSVQAHAQRAALQPD